MARHQAPSDSRVVLSLLSWAFMDGRSHREGSGCSKEQERQEDGGLQRFQDEGHGHRGALVLILVSIAAYLYASSEPWGTTCILGGRGGKVMNLKTASAT